MKKNDVILIISTALYSGLLYHQALGFNFFLFSIALTILLAIFDKSVLQNNWWRLAAGCSLISGFAVWSNGTILAFWANFLSLSLLSALSFSKNSSVILAGVYALYSFLSSFVWIILDIINRKDNHPEGRKNRFWVKVSIAIGILLVVVLFFVLYQRANPLFKQFTEKINFDWISWGWLWFTLGGFLLMYGFFYHRNFPSWYNWDTSVPDNLSQESIMAKPNKFLGRVFRTDTEKNAGVVLLALLNILVLFVNLLDIVYLWLSDELPKGMSHSDLVHQGVGNLIFSVILAILILLFFFRSQQNFLQNNRWLKQLAFIWMIQNAFMVISAVHKNQLYILEYSLTYKRIIIFFYLFLTLAGLLFTWMKISKKQSNWFLIKINAWALVVTFAVAAVFNWDRIIADYNLAHSKKFDSEYFQDMNYGTFPALFTFYYQNKYLNNDSLTLADELINRERTQYLTDQERLQKKTYRFLLRYDTLGWPSWCLGKSSVKAKLKEMASQGMITSWNISRESLKDLGPLAKFDNIMHLDISGNPNFNLQELKSLNKLNSLDLSAMDLQNLEKLPTITSLQTLILDFNSVSDFSKLSEMKKLQSLSIANNDSIDLNSLTSISLLNDLNISGMYISDFSPLGKMYKLKALKMNSMKNVTFNTLPEIKALESLDVSDNKFDANLLKMIQKLSEFKNLKQLNLSSNHIVSLTILNEEFKPDLKTLLSERELLTAKTPLLPLLQSLDVSQNDLASLHGLENYTSLEYLNASRNRIIHLQTLENLKKLKYLYVNQNRISDIKALNQCTQLRVLNLANNEITSIEALSGMKNLIQLSLAANNLSSIEPLKNLVQLRVLNLQSCGIDNIAVLSNLKNLEELDVSGNYIKDYSPLYQLKTLKKLYISEYSPEKIEEIKKNIPGIIIEKNRANRNE